jgi:hypothetical protein
MPAQDGRRVRGGEIPDTLLTITSVRGKDRVEKAGAVRSRSHSAPGCVFVPGACLYARRRARAVQLAPYRRLLFAFIQNFFMPVMWIVLVAAFNVPVICTVSPTYG